VPVAPSGRRGIESWGDANDVDTGPSKEHRQQRRYVVGVHAVADDYGRLRPPAPTADEICTCPPSTPIKLMGMNGLSYNPIHCLRCNREVPPERLNLDRRLADAIADWRYTYDAIGALELASGIYESWARAQLLDADSPPNVEGREIAGTLNQFCRCYFWFFQPDSDDGFVPRSTCPVCGDPLALYSEGIFSQLLCERDRLVLVGE